MIKPLIVQKYGGTCLASIEKLKGTAQRIVETRRQGFGLVVVVSAMDKTTDHLMTQARAMSADPDRRELDMLLATGEITSMALLAMALRGLGEKAISLSGGQAGILTNEVHTNARILGIDSSRLRRELTSGAIVVVAGFQGVDSRGELTTLGRGGSDTTATALAAALGADRCQIFTDVDAVYSADPRVVESAYPLRDLSSVEMEEIAWHGAQVMKAEAVEFAKSNGIDFEVLSPYGRGPGTRICTATPDAEVFVPLKPAVAEVSGRRDLIRLQGAAEASDSSELPEEVFRMVAGYDLVFGKLERDAGTFDLLLSDLEIPDPKELCRQLEQRFGDAVTLTHRLGAVSLIGFGLGSRPTAFLEAFRILEDAGIHVRGSFTGRESLSFLVDHEQVKTGIQTLHRLYIENRDSSDTRRSPTTTPLTLHPVRSKQVVSPLSHEWTLREGEHLMVNFATFETLESEVRSYCRSFPTVFEKAQGSCLYDADERRYLDFFSGAGALNYGHANPQIKRRLIDYLEQDGIIHSLDMATAAKGTFLERLHRVILEPRGFDYKVQFPSPTGTNAVEACLKLARKATGRKTVAYFDGAFHGMTLGALSVSGDLERRQRAGIPLDHTVELPFEYDTGGPELAESLERQWSQGSPEDLPAAVILETVQAEGGVRAASTPWLRQLQDVTKRFGVLLIVDDIQVGCGRTGTFFSFEEAGLEPDLICLSKSIGGYGLPLSLVLLRPELDLWSPGEHNGTFRGQNLSFVAGTEALSYWQDEEFGRAVMAKAAVLRAVLDRWVAEFPDLVTGSLGRGLIQGLSFTETGIAGRLSRAAFQSGLVIECAGSSDQILKFLPALTISEDELREGLDIVEDSLRALESHARPVTATATAG